TVTAATTTKLTVTLSGTLTTGALDAVVTTDGVSSGAAVQVATVTPVVTTSTASLATNGTTLTINGLGFDTVNPGNNVVAFSGAGVGTLTGTVTAATATSLTVTL